MTDHSLGIRFDTFKTRRISTCEKKDAFGFLKIVHFVTHNETDTWMIVLPHNKKPEQINFPNIKTRHSILKKADIISMEATGLCFCWEVYESPYYGGEKELIYPGDRYRPEFTLGSLKKVSCPRGDD